MVARFEDYGHKIMLNKLSLTYKIIFILLFFMLVNSVLLIKHAEEQLELSILDQVKEQVVIFLFGIEREIQNLANPSDQTSLEGILRSINIHKNVKEQNFTPIKIYVYDSDGKVLAHTEPGKHEDKDIGGYHGQVFRTGRPYISEEIEVKYDEKTGKDISVIDVIVPLVIGGKIVGGIETEINLEKTMENIQTIDDQYEKKTALVIIIQALILFFLLWWVIHRILISPITQYDQVTRDIASGDLSSRIKSRLSKDELGRLGSSVNVMADSIERLIQEQEDAYLQTLVSLMKALEAKDEYTARHSSRVSKYSVKLGEYIGIPKEKLELLKKGALMHDIGKIGIPDAILNKRGSLNAEEYEIIKTHPVKTAIIMRPLKRFKEFTEIAAWHHERWDGKGYPDGLSGDKIPLLARIVSIADAWDALTGDRVYRQGMQESKALDLIKNGRDLGQWDPQLIDTFIRMMENNR